MMMMNLCILLMQQHADLVYLVIVEPGNSYEERTILSQEWTAAMEKNLLQPNEHRQSTFGSATLAVWETTKTKRATGGNRRIGKKQQQYIAPSS
eukprot:scaffold11468_cov183-Skeletonema_marinoi.AAC.1